MQKQDALITVYFICLFILFLSSCEKYKDPGSDLSRLPLETQSGANTFGCVVDGKVFLPFAKTKILNYQKPLTCYYIPNRNHSYYTFGLYASNNSDDLIQPSVSIRADSIVFKQGQTYIFKDHQPYNAYASYERYSNYYFYEYYTDSQVTGQLYISKLDTVSNIISGTFSFKGANARASGDTIHVTQGRFDVKYE